MQKQRYKVNKNNVNRKKKIKNRYNKRKINKPKKKITSGLLNNGEIHKRKTKCSSGFKYDGYDCIWDCVCKCYFVCCVSQGKVLLMTTLFAAEASIEPLDAPPSLLVY